VRRRVDVLLEFFILAEINFIDHCREPHFSYVGQRPLFEVQLANMQPLGKGFAALFHLNIFSNTI
jgi:hypothetical protein